MAKRRLDAADANVAAAQAQLALLNAGARAEDLSRAQSRVDQASAALVAATQAVSDTEAIRANPQSLLIAKANGEASVQAANYALTASARQAEGADLLNQFWQDQVQSLEQGVDITLPGGGKLHFDTPGARIVYARGEWFKAGNAAWQAWIGVARAQANLVTAQGGLKGITDQLTNPIALDTRVDQARAARDRAAADLQTAQAALKVLREGATPAQIQTASAALDQMRAARSSLAQDLDQYRIVAPQAGTVAQTFYRKGEVIAASVPLLRLSVDGELTLRVYVPTATLSQVRLGDAVEVNVPDLNAQPVNGTITHIADNAEFTSRQAQTDSERNALLIEVQITVKTVDHSPKPGMPADVSFGPPASATGLNFNLLQSNDPLIFSGTLEAKQTRIASEVVGDVTNVAVDKGDAVKSGAALISLDENTIQSNLREADAAVLAAQSNVDQVNEKALPGQVAVAQAAVSRANVDLRAANDAFADANRALDSKQDVSSQVQIWNGKLDSAQADASQAQAALASIKNQLDLAQQDLSKAGQVQLAIVRKQQEAANSTFLAAQATITSTQTVLDIYAQILDNPLELIAAQHAAAGQVKVAQVGLAVAQAELDIVNRAPRVEEVALAEARLSAAKANQELVQSQAARFTIASPLDGTVVGRSVELGETVRPGAALLTIADTQQLEMTVFVPVRSLGALHVGQTANLSLPSLPGKTFNGQVTFIAAESEFKPANIYNSQERSEMVFAVRVTVPNSTGELKAGLPADATMLK
jgi:HlyD family secretion protein